MAFVFPEEYASEEGQASLNAMDGKKMRRAFQCQSEDDGTDVYMVAQLDRDIAEVIVTCFDRELLPEEVGNIGALFWDGKGRDAVECYVQHQPNYFCWVLRGKHSITIQ